MTSFWNVAKTKRRNGDVVVDNSSETFHRFLFSVFFSEFFLHGPSVSDWRLIGLRYHSTPPPPPPFFSDLPRSVRQRFFPDRGRTQGPRHPRSFPKLVTTFFVKGWVSFFQQTTEKEVKIVVSFGFGLDIFFRWKKASTGTETIQVVRCAPNFFYGRL